MRPLFNALSVLASTTLTLGILLGGTDAGADPAGGTETLAAWAGPALGGGNRSVTPPPRVLVFGWDGTQKNHFKDLYDKGLLPASQSLAANGNLVEIYLTGSTATKAGWSTVLSGYDAPITGAYSNWIFQPIPDGFTIFEKLRAHYGPGQPIESDGVYTLMVTGKDHQLGTHWDTSRGLGEPFYNVVDDIDWRRTDVRRPNQEVYALAREGLEDYALNHHDEPLFAFVHFAEPDSLGHDFGESSPQYTAAMIANDRLTGQLIQDLQTMGIGSGTQVYITTDHGFDEQSAAYPAKPKKIGKTHDLAPYTFVVTNNPQVISEGHQHDLCPTFMETFAMNLTDPAYPALSGQPLTQAKKVDGGRTNRVPHVNLKRVFLISWSGMNRKTLRERMAAEPSRFPNLLRLQGDGGWIDIDITRALKDKPHNALPGNDPVAGTVNLLTGYDFDRTGCYNHERLAQLPVGWTVFERFEDYFAGQNENIITALYMTRDVDRHAYGTYPDNLDHVLANNRPQIDYYASDLLNTTAVTNAALQLITGHAQERMLIYLHYALPDINGHRFGEGSRQYISTAETLDQELGRLLAHLDDLGIYADSLVYVTSPAGFSRQDAPQPQPFGANGFNHQQGAFVFLVTNDGKIREGYGNQLRIAPTLLKSQGIDTGRKVFPRYSKHLRKNVDWDIIHND